MKRIFIYITISVLSLTSYAQSDDHDAMESAFQEILISDKGYNPVAVDSLANMLSLKSKKDPDVQVRLARSYYRAQNRKKANEYIERAFDAKKDYSRAYVLQGDIALADYDSTKAVNFYEKAIAADPRDEVGYKKYTEVVAKKNPDMAISKLEQLRKMRPDYPIDIAQGNIWMSVGAPAKALEVYKKVNMVSMDEGDLVYYATALWQQNLVADGANLLQYCNERCMITEVVTR